MIYLLMMNFLQIINSILLEESGSVQVIEMIELSSWEWFLLLMSVILVIWLLILFQIRLTKQDDLSKEYH